MVKINFERNGKSFCILMKRPCEAESSAEDLAYCAASTLVYTAAQRARQLYEEGMLSCEPKAEVYLADLNVEVVAKQECLAIVEQMFRTVYAGLTMVADRCPKYIQLRCNENGEQA